MTCLFCEADDTPLGVQHDPHCPTISPDPTIRMLADAFLRVGTRLNTALYDLTTSTASMQAAANRLQQEADDLDSLIQLLSDDDQDDPPINPILN